MDVLDAIATFIVKSVTILAFVTLCVLLAAWGVLAFVMVFQESAWAGALLSIVTLYLASSLWLFYSPKRRLERNKRIEEEVRHIVR